MICIMDRRDKVEHFKREACHSWSEKPHLYSCSLLLPNRLLRLCIELEIPQKCGERETSRLSSLVCIKSSFEVVKFVHHEHCRCHPLFLDGLIWEEFTFFDLFMKQVDIFKAICQPYDVVLAYFSDKKAKEW